jgi:hypothetical protein
MKLKLFLSITLLLGIFYAGAQAPLNPFEVRNLKAKSAADNTALQVPAITADGSKAYKVTVKDLWPYTMYTALVSQATTAAPTATVLQKTISGTATWTRSSAGIYVLKILPAPFTANKTVAFFTGTTANTIFTKINYQYLSDSTLQFRSAVPGVTTIDSLVDGKLSGVPLEIRVYH